MKKYLSYSIKAKFEMKVGELVTFTLPSSKKKMAGKILEVRDKKVVVQSKDGKKLIPKTLLTMKKKKAPPKITGEQMKSIKVLGVKGQIPKKVVKEKKVVKKTYLVKVDGEKDRKLTLSLLKQFINKRFEKQLSNSQEKNLEFMANSILKDNTKGHFIISGDLIYTSKNRKSNMTDDFIGKIDMGEKTKKIVSEDQKKDKQLEKEKKEEIEDQKAEEHNEKYSKMKDLKDLWNELKDLKWSNYDRSEINKYINSKNIYGPAFNSNNPKMGYANVKAEVIKKGKRPVKDVLVVYYSKLTGSGRLGKFKKDPFDFPRP